MDKNDDKRQQLIRLVLTSAAGANDAEVVAHALRIWARLAAHLGALIGEAGFCALYGRTMRLVMPHHPCFQRLGASGPSPTVDVLLAALGEHLASDPEQAAAANAALLDTFTRQLSGLIGEALTTRLLNTAWADEPEGKNK